MVKRVLSVGQCQTDDGMLQAFLEQHFGAELESAKTADETLSSLYNGPFDLVLVNRIFDSDGGSGIELIQTLKLDGSVKKLPVMLISNYEDAQNAAVSAGAELGFGKAELGSELAVERLRPLLNEEEE